jgi:Fe-S cluster assembly ATP-binding protein
MLEIKNLNVSVGNRKIIENFSLSIGEGEVLVLRGKNGIGKSTLAAAIMNDPAFTIKFDKMEFENHDLFLDSATTRALMGMYYAPQNVPEIPGLTLSSFFKHSMNARKKFNDKQEISAGEFFEKLNAARTRLNIPESWLARSVNVGFSGGERKRVALMGLILAKPRLAILDEIDAGADAALQKEIADTINELNAAGTSFLIISHQENFIKLLNRPREEVL